MRFEGDSFIPADPDTVWKGLNDPEVLQRAIPGCTAMERTGESEFTATAVARVGPVSATLKGRVELADLNPPASCTLRGRGQGGPAGFAKGQAQIALAPEGDGTRLSYIADVDAGGKLASVGGRLIQGLARKNADEFFAAFSRVLTGEDLAEIFARRGGEAIAGANAGAGVYGGHIPLIDRVARLIVGVALGVAATLYFG